jgi:hypothetical protein
MAEESNAKLLHGSFSQITARVKSNGLLSKRFHGIWILHVKFT